MPAPGAVCAVIRCNGRLALAPLGDFGGSIPDPIVVDLRPRAGLARTQPLGRAFGLHRGARPRILDATAGLGRDAAALAGMSADVHMVERNPLLTLLLREALDHAGPVSARLRLTGPAESRDVLDSLRGLPDAPDAVLVDPMFPEPERRRAAVRKELQVLRDLLPPDPDPPQIWMAAMATATQRVVVKRHPGDPPLGGVPSFQVPGKRVRFDVYLTGRPT